MSAQDRAALVERLKARALQHELLVEQHIQAAKRFDDRARAAISAAQADYDANRADSYRRQSEGPAAEAAMLREAVAALATPPAERVEVMSFRDYCAAKALQGMCSGQVWPHANDGVEMALRAYRFADEMIKRRAEAQP